MDVKDSISNAELIEKINFEKKAIEMILSKYTEDEIKNCKVCEDISIKDIVAHITEWNDLVLQCYEIGKSGEVPSELLEKLYENKENKTHTIFNRYKQYDYDYIIENFDKYHERVLNMINTISEENLNKTGLFPWMKDWTLADWIIGNVVNHYRDGRKIIEDWEKE